MELEVMKIEEGLCSGRVLHHAYVEKSAAEVNEQQTEVEEQRKLKEQRRKQQVPPPPFLHACTLAGQRNGHKASPDKA